MARSKSPGPSTRKAKAKAAPAAEDFAPLGLTVAALLVVWFLTDKDLAKDPLGSFAKSATGGFAHDFPWGGEIPVLSKWIGSSCVFATLMHQLNTIDRNNGSGYWLNSFVQTVIATYGCIIVNAVMNGTSFADAIFTAEVPGFFFLWYVITQEIPFCPADFGAWGKIKDIGGPAFQNLLDLGSEIFVTNAVIAAVGTAGAMFSQSWFKGIAMGCIAGTASSFFPFNKGVKFVKSAALSNALAVSFFVASDGFKVIDYFVGELLNVVGQKSPFALGDFLTTQIVNRVSGSTAEFVIVVTVFNFLFGDILEGLIGDLIAQVPVLNLKMGKGFDMFGITAEVLSRTQLN